MNIKDCKTTYHTNSLRVLDTNTLNCLNGEKVRILHKTPRSRGFRAGTKLAKLAGQLGKYTKAMINDNKLAKRQARSTIAAMIGV